MSECKDCFVEEAPPMRPGTFLGPKVPGYNIDRIDVDAGMRMLDRVGYSEPHTQMVIGHALNLWRRGEESQAEKSATDTTFHGIDYQSWLMVISAARAGGEAAAQEN